jgi:hypothetical protein
MDIEEVRDWLKGSQVAERIESVLAAREALFSSSRWATIVDELEKYRFES